MTMGTLTEMLSLVSPLELQGKLCLCLVLSSDLLFSVFSFLLLCFFIFCFPREWDRDRESACVCVWERDMLWNGTESMAKIELGETKKNMLMSFNRPEWPIWPSKRLRQKMLLCLWEQQTKLSKKVNEEKSDKRILLSIHVRFSSQIDCNFYLRKIWSKMEISLKQGKHLWWWKIMAFIFPWQGCWGCGSWGQVLLAQEIATVWYIVNPLQYPAREPTCVACDWIPALVGTSNGAKECHYCSLLIK